MALKATIYKADLQIADMDRNYYETHLLTLALRVLTLFEVLVRRGQDQSGEELQGLYPGQGKRTTDRPTAQAMSCVAAATSTDSR